MVSVARCCKSFSVVASVVPRLFSVVWAIVVRAAATVGLQPPGIAEQLPT
jgi:hypothetical protein